MSLFLEHQTSVSFNIDYIQRNWRLEPFQFKVLRALQTMVLQFLNIRKIWAWLGIMTFKLSTTAFSHVNFKIHTNFVPITLLLLPYKMW